MNDNQVKDLWRLGLSVEPSDYEVREWAGKDPNALVKFLLGTDKFKTRNGLVIDLRGKYGSPKF